MIIYLLSIEELIGADAGGLLTEAFSRVDSERRRKAEGIRPGRAQAACLGAGLVLQLAVWDTLEPEERDGGEEVLCDCSPDHAAVHHGLRRYTMSGLLDILRPRPPFQIAFRYGEKGKPYFSAYPIYFSLSHSGDYVLCALSGEEVGADIQQHHAGAAGRVARRFFSKQEVAALDSCKVSGVEDKDTLFFRLWTRKEAYGKLTGEGIIGAMGVNLLSRGIRLPDGRTLVWEEYGDIPGYSICVCHWKCP